MENCIICKLLYTYIYVKRDFFSRILAYQILEFDACNCEVFKVKSENTCVYIPCPESRIKSAMYSSSTRLMEKNRNDKISSVFPYLSVKF